MSSRGFIAGIGLVAVVTAGRGASAAPAATTIIRQLLGSYSVSADGRHVVADARHGGFALYDTVTGRVRRVRDGDTTGSDFLISADGRRVVYNRFTGRDHAFALVRVYSVRRRHASTVAIGRSYRVVGLDPTGRVAAVVRSPDAGARTVGSLDLRTRRFQRYPPPPDGLAYLGPIALSNSGARAVLTASGPGGAQHLVYVRRLGRLLEAGASGDVGPAAISADGHVTMVGGSNCALALLGPDLTPLATLPNANRTDRGLCATPTADLSRDGNTALQACGATFVLYSLVTRHYARLLTVPGTYPGGGNARLSGAANRVFVETDFDPGTTRANVVMVDTAHAVDIGPGPPAECSG